MSKRSTHSKDNLIVAEIPTVLLASNHGPRITQIQLISMRLGLLWVSFGVYWGVFNDFNSVSSIHDIHDHTQSDIGKDVEVIVADPLNINNQYSIGTFKFSQLLRENGRMVQSKATKTKVTNWSVGRGPDGTERSGLLDTWIEIKWKIKVQLQELVRRFCSAKELMFVTEGNFCNNFQIL